MGVNRHLHITVAYSPAPRQVHEVALTLPEGSTVADALAASGLSAHFPDMDTQPGRLGVWGRRASPEQRLQERDRVEVWRPLRVDPKLARRQRFDQQGARAAGLFARRRPGAKPGY
jgi:putative ubiquitin-RnfH superfamily antitoxin RatB of RatAB toxin-antitoxin module